MQKLIKNNWLRESTEPFNVAHILRHEIHPEGLDVDRLQFVEAGPLVLNSNVGHLISVLSGSGTFRPKDNRRPLHLEKGVHTYVPPGFEMVFEGEPGTELLRVSSPSDEQARGTHLVIRDEKFLAACASGSQSFRWVLTPQYLSRRIFLYHDQTLLSKSGNPVSWFHTTMFDVKGLPSNEDGEPVFKMSYNSRTEFNVCYHVKGTARVRMAQHPYQCANQAWSEWLLLDSDSTYHLNEEAGGPEEECLIDEASRASRFFRNKHEVQIVDGHVTLFCMFDPAPTGIERHRPGEYSDYQSLSEVLETLEYERQRREIIEYDKMVDQLSLAKAMGELDNFRGTQIWEMYQKGRRAQADIEDALVKTLALDGENREKILAAWMLRQDD